jgi:hypothetical protein
MEMPVPLFVLGYSIFTEILNTGEETTENFSSSWIFLYRKHNAHITK